MKFKVGDTYYFTESFHYHPDYRGWVIGTVVKITDIISNPHGETLSAVIVKSPMSQMIGRTATFGDGSRMGECLVPASLLSAI